MSKPRALIIGAKGFLGAYAARTAADAFEVIRADRTPADQESIAVDVADASSVNQAFKIAKPDAVLLLAAMSDIDRCEAQPEQAFAVNVRGAENVANACAKSGARLLFTSTAAVFDGRRHGYAEEDSVSPLSVYGTTKARAEAVVQALVPSAVIIRVSLVLGMATRTDTNSLINSLVQRWKEGKSVPLPTFEFRNPIHAGVLSKIMVALLADRNVRGIYHAGASDSISRYELGIRLAQRGGFHAGLVQPQREALPGRAPRGADHFLRTEKLQNVCGIGIHTCDDAIERCFS